MSSLDAAAAFLDDRGMLTVLPTSSLPSLFGSTEPPADMSAKGWSRWPPDIWWWDGALADRPGVVRLKVLKGKGLYVAERLIAVFDPLCRRALADAEARGPADDRRLLAHLGDGGPVLIDDVKHEIGFETAPLRAVRKRLESVGAVVSVAVEVPAANGGHRHTSELHRWDQLTFAPRPTRTAPDADAAIGDLLGAAVGAAVAAPQAEATGWFTWPCGAEVVDRLVDEGRLVRPAAGWLAAP